MSERMISHRRHGRAEWRRDLIKDPEVFGRSMGGRVGELPLPQPHGCSAIGSEFCASVRRCKVEVASSLKEVDDIERMCLVCFACFPTDCRVAIRRAHASGHACALRERVGGASVFCGNDCRFRIRLIEDTHDQGEGDSVDVVARKERKESGCSSTKSRVHSAQME